MMWRKRLIRRRLDQANSLSMPIPEEAELKTLKAAELRALTDRHGLPYKNRFKAISDLNSAR